MNTKRRHGCFRTAAAAVIAVLAGCGLPRAARAGDVRISETAEIDRATVLLGDIAEFNDFDPEFEARLRVVVMSDAPRAGLSRAILAAEVRDTLQRSGANLVDMHIYGSSQCIVTRKRVDVDPADAPSKPIIHKPAKPLRRHADLQPVAPAANTLDAAIRDYIDARIARDDGRLEISLNRTDRATRDALDSTVGPGTYRIRERDPLGLGLCALDVELLRDGRVIDSLGVIGEIELVKPVLVARKPINRGSTIDRAELKLEERRFSRPSEVGISDMEVVEGYEATRFIQPGEMLSTRSLRQKPVIERGDIVKILVSGNGVQITTTGKAQASGALGDTIPVARNGSRRKQDVIDAMITGPGVVTYGGVRQVARR
ncbi:MAG: flagellar basal body P-ring formation protein FlgA [Phycisphaerales bacterium]|nr:flagellar basal body P-ring formation protein FlgA [Phycisphaerales bacterium]MCB9862536.1 flagellar basal body P-ring formation protein FlgA [Phycisphaerales bacterium]